jgi:hypothetical protein
VYIHKTDILSTHQRKWKSLDELRANKKSDLLVTYGSQPQYQLLFKEHRLSNKTVKQATRIFSQSYRLLKHSGLNLSIVNL